MKKILVLLGLIVALSTTFVSCTEEEVVPISDNNDNVHLNKEQPGQF